jgi:prophage regulatory protein
MKLLRLNDVMNKTGLSRSSIYKQMSINNFPPQVKLGTRIVAWHEAAVDNWITSKLEGAN